MNRCTPGRMNRHEKQRSETARDAPDDQRGEVDQGLKERGDSLRVRQIDAQRHQAQGEIPDGVRPYSPREQ